MANLKLSRYNIYQEYNHQLAVLNGITGEIVIAEGKLRDYIKNNIDQVIIEAYKDKEIMKQLIQKGIINRLNLEQEVEYFSNIVANMQKAALLASHSYILLPTYQCNLSCQYCYQKKFDLYSQSRLTMDKNMVDNIFSSIARIESKRGETRQEAKHITLFGGEPLLKGNQEIIHYIFKKALALGHVKMTIITNGYGLEDYHDLLGSDCIEHMQITLDGPEDIHDQVRITKGGNGTYKKILDNIKSVLDQGIKVNIRVNVDRRNIHQLPRLASELMAWNIHKYPHASVYVGVIHQTIQDKDISHLLDEYDVLTYLTSHLEEYPQLALYGLPEAQIMNSLQEALTNGHPATGLFRSTHCQAHSNNLCFDVNGHLFTCLENDGTERYIIGKLEQKGDITWEDETIDFWQKRQVSRIEACKICPYALFCGGGCAIRAEERHGDYMNHYCNGYQAVFQYHMKKVLQSMID